jgi:4-hydroxy-4-methyl-2-oxoglutarate aldolase
MTSPDASTVPSLDPTPADLIAFEQLPTSALCDAMDELGVPSALPGLMPQRPQQGTVVGRAMTARFAPVQGDGAAYRFGGGVGKPLEQVLKTMRRGDVVVMDLGGTTTASAWGGLASRIAMTRGVRGTVIHGTCRDLPEIQKLGYPVWSVGTFPRRSRNDFSFGSLQEPVQIGPVRICPGDIIVADETGVVRVPHDRFREVLDLAASITTVEQQQLAKIGADEIPDWDAV